MGRFATTAEFYARYREPYTPEFFAAISRELAFRKSDALLDVACGPGLLAIGFAPYVASCTGVDPEPNMISAARQAATEAGIALTLHQSRIEDFASPEPFPIITIGRALHWLDRDSALAALDRLLAPRGRIIVCGASTDPDLTPWVKPYNELRNRYADLDHNRYRHESAAFFAGSSVRKVADIRVPHAQAVTVNDLVLRSHSKSNTAPAVLGNRLPQLEHELRELLLPYATDGVLEEHITARATVFAR